MQLDFSASHCFVGRERLSSPNSTRFIRPWTHPIRASMADMGEHIVGFSVLSMPGQHRQSGGSALISCFKDEVVHSRFHLRFPGSRRSILARAVGEGNPKLSHV